MASCILVAKSMSSYSIVLGLISSLAFGLLDIFIAFAARSIGIFQSLILAQALSASILFFCLIPVFLSGISFHTFCIFLLVGAALGVVNTLANLSLYKGLEFGPIALVSPVSASYGLVTTLLAITFFHEFLLFPQFMGILLILAGMIFSAIEGMQRVFLAYQLKMRKTQFVKLETLFQRPQYKGFLFGLLSMVAFGIEFFGTSLASGHLGPLQPIFWSRLCSFFLLITYTSRRSYRWQQLNLSQYGLITLIGIADSIGMVWYDLGTDHGTTSIVAALSSTYILLPTVVGVIFYRERLSLLQWVGIGTLALGVMLLSFNVLPIKGM